MEPCHFAVRPNDSPMPPCPESTSDRADATVPFMARLGGGLGHLICLILNVTVVTY